MPSQYEIDMASDARRSKSVDDFSNALLQRDDRKKRDKQNSRQRMLQKIQLLTDLEGKGYQVEPEKLDQLLSQQEKEEPSFGRQLTDYVGITDEEKTEQPISIGDVLKKGAKGLSLDDQLKKAKIAKLNREGSGKGAGLTKGQEAFDKEAGKKLYEYESGGKSIAEKNLQQLRDAQNLLQTKDVTGTRQGLLGDLPLVGDSLLALTDPEAVGVKENIEEVVQANLKNILGAQFTEKDAEQLFARTFNLKLSEAENSKRLGRLIKQIEYAKQAKDQQLDYFRQNGTLTGFKGPSINSIDDLEKIQVPEDNLQNVAMPFGFQGQIPYAPNGTSNPLDMNAYAGQPSQDIVSPERTQARRSRIEELRAKNAKP